MTELFAIAATGFTLVLGVGTWLEYRDQQRRAADWEQHCADAQNLTGGVS